MTKGVRGLRTRAETERGDDCGVMTSTPGGVDGLVEAAQVSPANIASEQLVKPPTYGGTRLQVSFASTVSVFL